MPELCLGLFATSPLRNEGASKSNSPASRKELVAHVIGTQSNAGYVTDESMDFPEDWTSDTPNTSVKGQQDGGRTILIHSIAVLPEHRGKGLGKVIMKSYLQRMESSGVADRISLIAHHHLVKFHESLNFTNEGKSRCKFGGGEWYDMVRLDDATLREFQVSSFN